MLAVIITIVFAIGVAYFATQNTAQVSIGITGYNWSVPIYLVVLISLLVGFVFAWLLHLMNASVAFFSLMGKDRAIKKGEKANKELSHKVHDLEIEKTRLETEKKSQPSE